MTAPLRHRDIRLDALEVFELRCWARALLYCVGEIGLHEAVDILQLAAVRTGLVDLYGQDRLQQIMADAFHRECPR